MNNKSNENLEVVTSELSDSHPVLNEESNPPVGVKVLKKRGRKPSGKVLDIKNIEEKNITSSLDPEKECLIIHLPINLKDIEKMNKNKNKLDKITETPTETEFNTNVFIEEDKSKSEKENLDEIRDKIIATLYNELRRHTVLPFTAMIGNYNRTPSSDKAKNLDL